MLTPGESAEERAGIMCTGLFYKSEYQNDKMTLDI